MNVPNAPRTVNRVRMTIRRMRYRLASILDHNRRRSATMQLRTTALILVAGFISAPIWLRNGTGAREIQASAADELDRVAARLDPYVEKQRVVVLTDIANEPDDQMSMVRFLVYANEFDVEGLVAGTSTWMRNRVRPDVIQHVIDAYDGVLPTLSKHARGFPAAADLRAVVTTGQPGYGMAAVGPDRMSAGAERIIQAADGSDPRPLWILVWRGSNTLAQALLHVRSSRPAARSQAFVSKLRVY